MLGSPSIDDACGEASGALDKTRSQDGVGKIKIKTGAFPKSKVQLMAKGSTANWPQPVSGGKLFNADPYVIVTLVNDGNDTCWLTSFNALDKNTESLFKYP